MIILTGRSKKLATFATRAEVLRALPRGERRQVTRLHRRLSEGVTLAEISRVHGLSPTAVRRLRSHFRFGPLILDGYPAILSRLMGFSSEFDREVYGYYERRSDRFALWAKLGEETSCPAQNRKRTFHTHSQASLEKVGFRSSVFTSYDLSGPDFIALLAATRTMETINASPEGALLARKTTPELTRQAAKIIKRMQTIIVHADWEVVSSIINVDLDRHLTPQEVRQIKKPSSPDRDSIYTQMVGNLMHALTRGHPFDHRRQLLQLGVELEEYSTTLDCQQYPANPRTDLLQNAYRSFQENPNDWIRNTLAPCRMTIYDCIKVKKSS